jgi:flagellar protein FliO/FliZ
MDLWWSFVKMAGALVAVLGLMGVTAYAAKRWLGSGTGLWGARSPLHVLATLPLGPKRQIMLVAVGETCLVVGVTATQISLLTTLDPSAIPPGLVRAPVGDQAA